MAHYLITDQAVMVKNTCMCMSYRQKKQSDFKSGFSSETFNICFAKHSREERQKLKH